jgi:hypothetical protein
MIPLMQQTLKSFVQGCGINFRTYQHGIGYQKFQLNLVPCIGYFVELAYEMSLILVLDPKLLFSIGFF